MSDFLDLAIGHDLIDHGTSDDYYTPPHIFEALGLTFDMDVSAPPGGVPWIPARRSIDVIEDGLATPWVGLVWCNPPYSNPSPWIDKFIAHNHGVALIPTSTGAWMLNLWKVDANWCMLKPMKFVKSNYESAKGSLPSRCWLIAVGNISMTALKTSGLGHVR